ncbi:MAG: hypothetical protein AAFP20_06470 [Cyanobacteria bacterium J06614_10]
MERRPYRRLPLVVMLGVPLVWPLVWPLVVKLASHLLQRRC